MKRRNFLELSQLMIASYCLSSSCGRAGEMSTTGDDRPSVLILGAGLAGLAAAQQLVQAGYEVHVLEARDRLGGRTWTSQQWDDVPLDLGASWIHGMEGNPLRALATAIDTPLVMTSYDRAITYGITGEPLTDKEQQTLLDLQTQIDQAIAKAQKQGKDQSLQTILETALDWPNQPLATQQLLYFLLNSTIEQEYAGSLEELSAHWFDDAESYGGEDALFQAGYQTIVEHLAQNVDVKLNHIVQHIDWSGNTPQVTTNQGNYKSDLLVITLPLGVLQSTTITFNPPLPADKREAIASLGVGVLNKCYLRFPEIFWEEDVDWIEQVAQDQGFWTEWVNLAPMTGQPILLGFNAANQGKIIETWPDEKIVQSAMDTLNHLFGLAIPEPMDYQITRWHSDPFALGSYSFNAVGSTPEMRDRLAAPLNEQLFFAGEATARDHFATAHGAYLSGLRVAEEIISLSS